MKKRTRILVNIALNICIIILTVLACILAERKVESYILILNLVPILIIFSINLDIFIRIWGPEN